MNPEWVNLGVSVICLIGYGYHAIRTIQLWRSDETAHNLRDLYVVTMIEVAMVVFLVGALARLAAGVPPSATSTATGFAVFTGYIVRGMLLVGAIVVSLTWPLPDVRHWLKKRE